MSFNIGKILKTMIKHRLRFLMRVLGSNWIADTINTKIFTHFNLN